MKSPLISALLMLFSASVLADASIDSQEDDKTFLLSAPGTLSGVVKGGRDDHQASELSEGAGGGTLPDQDGSAASTPRFPPQQQRKAPPQQYRYVEDNVRKFRQFGQTSGQNNPWFDENGRRYAPPSKPMTSHPITNPWQLGGMPPMMGQTENRARYAAPYPYSQYDSGAYMTDSRLYPDYPDGIYRDNNPALLGMPGQSGFLPGFDGNSFPLPFSPFGMF